MTWNGPLEKVDEYRYRIPKGYRDEMRTSALIFTREDMLDVVRGDSSPNQIANVTTLPSIVGEALAMPDVHQGYGFPIGGVAAIDAREGVISPGGVGYDINCGVRLVRTDLRVEDVKDKVKPLIDAMFKNVPSGVGSSGRVKVSRDDVREVLAKGAKWAVENGYGWQKDLESLEEEGCLDDADPDTVSDRAQKRGMPQLGSLGAGNHFLEIQVVDEILMPEEAKAFGIDREGQVVIMIHTGSRGLGYQVCDDSIHRLGKHFRKEGKRYVSNEWDIDLPDRELVCAPVNSSEGQRYIKSMSCAANYAWTNRQMIVHWVRESFESVLGQRAEDLGMDIVYDVAHNMAKLETLKVDGKERNLVVHRKGATRAFGPGREEVPSKYRKYGQPVLIPGDMGTASYLLVGTEKAMTESFGSTCHGAGRVMSRRKATKSFPSDKVKSMLNERNIYIRAATSKVISEESPNAYKDVESVVDVTHGAGISYKVARMRPLGVVKG